MLVEIVDRAAQGGVEGIDVLAEEHDAAGLILALLFPVFFALGQYEVMAAVLGSADVQEVVPAVAADLFGIDFREKLLLPDGRASRAGRW